MLFNNKKIREFMKQLENKKLPKELEQVTHALENAGPDNARPAFQKKLRQQLLMQHKTATQPERSSAKAKPVKEKAPRMPLFGGWKFAFAPIALILIAAIISYPFIPAPTVEGYSLKETVRKISYNAPIKVVFSQPMDTGSVENAFHIEPRIEGHTEWSGNSLLFYPKESFKVGDVYEVYVEKSAKSLLQKSMEYDYEETFQIAGPPQVVLFNPGTDSQEVDVNSKLTVMFDRPMTALKGLDDGEASVPDIQIAPALKGRFKWLGTDTISFIPEKLDYATTYTVTVPKGTVMADGGKTDEEFVSQFTTIKPSFFASTPYEMYTYAGPTTNVQLDFNQPMSLEKAKDFIHLYELKEKGDVPPPGVYERGGPALAENFAQDMWQEVPFAPRYMTVDDVKKREAMNGYGYGMMGMTSAENYDDTALKNSVVLVPTKNLSFHQIYFVKIDKDYPGAQGIYGLMNGQGIVFKTVGEISVLSTSPRNGIDMEKEMNPDTQKKYSGSYNWAEVVFSNPMDGSQKLEDFVTISPENTDPDTKEVLKPTLTLDYEGTRLSIAYAFKPSTNYTITIKSGLKDRFDQSLKENFTYTFRTPALSPGFNLLNSSDIDVVDRYKAPEYFVKTTNLDTLNFNLKKLSLEEFQGLYSNGYVDYTALTNMSGPFTSWDKKVENTFNEEVTTKLDLVKESGSAIEPGFYYFDVSSPSVIDEYTHKKIVQRQIFINTGLSLAVKRSRTEVLVWATSLKDGAPAPGVSISVNGNKEENTATTDSQGLAIIKVSDAPDGENAEYYNVADLMILGRLGDDLTVTHSSWSEGVAPWNFNIDMDVNPSEHFIYSYSDRPIYRPGHTVYFKGLVRKDTDGKFGLPAQQKLHAEIMDPNGEKVYEKDLQLNANGTFQGELTLGTQARIGGYTLLTSLPDAKGYNSTGYYNFRVTEYRKPDYELKLKADKENYVNGETAKIKVNGAYFFGAPMPGARIEWNVKSNDYYFFLSPDSDSPYVNKWFSFSDEGYLCYWGCEGEFAVISEGKAKLDEKGEYTLELPLNITDKKISQFYTVEVTAYDLNNQSVSNRVTVPVHAGEYYMGILNDEYVVQTGKPIHFEVVSVDFDGKPAATKQADVGLYKRNWNTVKKKNVDGGFYYENSYEDTLVEKKTINTDDQGHAVVDFDSKAGGNFKATVSSKDSRGNEIKASTTVYVTSDSYINWGRENNDKMELVADKLEYKPGDTAHILVKSPYKNVWALVTQERQNILSSQVMKIDSNSQTIDVPISDDSIPNVFLSVIVMKGGDNQAGLGEPVKGSNDERGVASFKVGYTTLQVDNISKQLHIDVSSDKPRYLPGEQVTLKVKTTNQSGKAMAADVSLSVVDKSVLSLVENVTADLLNAFYRKRMLGVSTAVTLTKALSRVNVQVEAGLKGGGGADKSKRGIFKDTAHWEASLKTDKNGDGELTFTLPDNLTTWQVLAIGITDDTLVGSQKYEFLVNKDVIVRPVLPRFLIVNDTMKMGGIVHNYTDKDLQFDVSLDAKGIELSGAIKQQIDLKSGEEKKVEWDAKVLNEQEAVLTFDAVAVGNDSYRDTLEQKLPIHPYSFPEVVATALTIDDNDKHVETVWLPAGIDPNFGELKVSASPTLTASIADGLEYLMTFPYGCVEQTASSLLPNLVLKQVLDLPTVKDDLVDVKQLQKNIDAGLQALYKYQQENGGWGIWETSQPTPYLTAYVLSTLHEAQKAGYAVDKNVATRGTTFLKNYMNEHPLITPNGSNKIVTNIALNVVLGSGVDMSANNPSAFAQKQELRYQANLRAYALYVLAEIGEPDLGLSNNLYDYKDELNIFAKAYLVMDYYTLSQAEGLDATVKTELEKKIDSLKTDILNKAKETPRGIHFEDMDKLYYLFDTDTRTTAIVLQMLSRVEPEHPYIPKILRNLLMEKKDGHYASTQETAVTLLALVDYLTHSGELEANYNGTITLNGAEKLNKMYSQKNITDQDVMTFALTEMNQNNQDNELGFVRTGSGKMYADINLKYYLPTEKIEPRDEGIVVTHEYFDVSDEKMQEPIETIKVGENLKVKMTVVVPEDRYYVMVEDYLPAGLEGIDFDLATAQQSLQGGGKGSYYENGYYGGGYYGGWYFNHSEVHDDRVMYFSDYLPKGVYEIDYFVRATTPGTFHDLPALAQELYFPEVFGRSEGKIFEVTE